MNAKRQKKTQNPNDSGIIPRGPLRAKARIVQAGLRLGAVAKAAGMPESSFSNYLAGRVRNPMGQLRIVIAFCELSGQVVTVRQFFGKLASKVA